MDTADGWAVLVRGFRLAPTVQGLRPSTVSHYVADVKRLADHMDGKEVGSVSKSDLSAYILDLHNGRAPKTVREAQLALRRFFRFLLREGEIAEDPTAGVPLVSYRVEPQPA